MCRYGRIFLTVAMGAGAAELAPAVSFTMEEAVAAKVGRCRLTPSNPR